MNMNLDDPNFMKEFLKIVREIIVQENKKLAFDVTESAVVTSVPSAGYCNIKFKNEGDDVLCKIRDGVTVLNGDTVRVTRYKNSNSNFEIVGK